VEAETEKKAMREIDERIKAGEADLKKKRDLVSNVNHKIKELVEKFRNDGYLRAGENILRTDLTAADRLITDPMMVTYEKCVTLI
jgi:hypothetical protein